MIGKRNYDRVSNRRNNNIDYINKRQNPLDIGD